MRGVLAEGAENHYECVLWGIEDAEPMSKNI